MSGPALDAPPPRPIVKRPVHPATFALAALGVVLLLAGQSTVGSWLLVAFAGAFALQKRTMNSYVLLAMVAGTVIGHEAPEFSSQHLGLFSDIFLHLIKTIVAPLLFSTLVVGIAGHSDLKSVGRMGLKAIIYFEVLTTMALIVGLAAINLSQAGVGFKQAETSGELPQTVAAKSAAEIILHVFPENIAKAVAENQVLQVVVFAVMFAVAMSQVPGKHREVMLHFIEALAEVMFKFTGLVMIIAPLGVFGAIAHTVGKMGIGSLVPLLKLLLTLYAALGFYVLCVMLPVALFFRVPILAFIKAIGEPVTIAFGTSTSEAALPLAMERLEGMGVPRGIVAFVMPTGYSFNLDGTTLYLALASVFVAQATDHAIAHDLKMQLFMVLTLMLTSKGVAGVPRASLVILLGTAAQFGLPVWPVAAILGIDSLMDMARTSVNVAGNCLATVVVAIWEKQFFPGAPPAERSPVHIHAAAPPADYPSDV